MAGIASLQGPLSTQQPVLESLSAPGGRAAGNLMNVRNSAHQPASVNNPQAAVDLKEESFIHLQNFVRQGLGGKPQPLPLQSPKKLKSQENKKRILNEAQNAKDKLNAIRFISEFNNSVELLNLTGSQGNIINNKSFINDFKLNVGFADFLLQDNTISNIIGEHLYLFVKGEREGYVSSEAIPCDTPVSTTAENNALESRQLPDGMLPHSDDVKTRDNNLFSVPGTDSNTFPDGKEKTPHPQSTTSSPVNIYNNINNINNINNDNRVINNQPVNIQRNFNFYASGQNDVNHGFQSEKVFVAGYHSVQETVAPYLAENHARSGDQNDGAKNIVKNVKAVTDTARGQQLSESVGSVGQPDGLLVADNLIARQENDEDPKTVAFDSVAVPKTDWSDSFDDIEPFFNEEVAKQSNPFAAPSADAHVAAAPDAAPQPLGSASASSVQVDGARGGNSATGNRGAGSTVTDEAKRPSENMPRSTVQVDGIRGGNSATGNPGAGSTVTDEAKRPSGNMPRSSVQVDGIRRGNSATGNRGAESTVTDKAKRPSGNMPRSTVQVDGSAARQAIQKGGYQQVTENGKTTWVKVGQSNPPLFLSDGGLSYRGMIVPRNSTATDRPTLFAASIPGVSGPAVTNTIQPPSVNTVRQSVQVDGIRGGNFAAASRQARFAVTEGAKRPSGSIPGAAVQVDDVRGGNSEPGNLEARFAVTEGAKRPSGSLPGAAVQVDGIRGGNFAAASRQARFAVMEGAKRPSGSLSGAAVQVDGIRGGNLETGNREARSTVTDEAKRPSGNMPRSTVQVDGIRGGSFVEASRQARSAVMAAAKRPSGSLPGAAVQVDGIRGGSFAAASRETRHAADVTQTPSQSTSGLEAQSGPWQKVTKNGKTSWINVRQEQPKVSLSEAGVNYRRMNIPNVRAKKFN